MFGGTARLVRRRGFRPPPRGPQKAKKRSVIRAKSNRKTRIRHGGKASPNPTVIERRVGRLQAFRRIATRYAKLAVNFLSSICLVATVAYWTGIM